MTNALISEARIRELIDMYKERRTDVADNLESLLKGTPFVPPESRFIKTNINDVWIEYDTLTTLFSYWTGEFDEDGLEIWETPGTHTYSDDQGWGDD